MSITSGIFGSESRYNERRQTSLKQVAELAKHCKGVGLKLVLTSGSFDIFHIGHALYLEAARAQGDLLFVGVDGDEKIRKRKGKDRPVVPEEERMQMLAFARPVDVIYLKGLNDPKWGLIKAIRPDVLIATEGTYSPEQVAELEEKYCGEVVILPPQATTSTSARLRMIQIGYAEDLALHLGAVIPGLVHDFTTNRQT